MDPFSDKFNDLGPPGLVGCGGCCLSSLFFVGIMLLPQTACFHCGTCCAVVSFIVFVFPMIAALFFGGMILNACNPAYFMMDAPCLFVCAVPQFLNFGGMAFLLTNPVQQYLKYRFSEDARGMSVCDAAAWEDKHGIYFSDGTLYDVNVTRSLTGTSSTERRLLSQRTAWVDIPHCSFHKPNKQSKGYWRSCEVAVRPVFGSAGSNHVCTWALAHDVEPAEPDCGVLSSGGLCGTIADYASFGAVLSPDSLSVGELKSGIAQFAANQSLTFDAATPYLKLGSPLAAEEELTSYVYAAVGMFLLYIPLPLTFLCCVAAASGDGVRTRGLAKEDSRELSIEDPQEEEEEAE